MKGRRTGTRGFFCEKGQAMVRNAIGERTGFDDQSLHKVLNDISADWGAKLIPLDIKEIKPSEGVRLKCLVPICEYYGVCKVCPPNIPDVSEFREALSNFEAVYLVVIQEEIEKIDRYRDDFSAEIRLGKIVSAIEAAAFQLGHYLAMGLTVGGCKLCKECTPHGEACRHPFMARPSPEGFGIDLTALARKAGVRVEWPPTRNVTFMGVLFV